MKTRKTRKMIALLMTAAMSAGLLAACGGGGTPSAGSGGSGSEDSPSQASQAAGETYELSLSMHDSATTLKGQYIQEWCDGLKEATDGALEISVFAGGTLASANTVIEAMETGVCDVAMVFTSYYDTIFPLTNGVTLPMLGIGNSPDATNVLWDIYEQSPDMAAEYDNYVLIHMYSNGASYIHLADKKVSTIEDLKGLKIRSGSGAMTDFLTGCGATPITIETSELYESLEKKLVDGNISTGSMMNSWNLAEVNKYFMDMPVYVGVWLTLMNRDVFEGLPQEIQDAILASGGRENSMTYADILQGESDSSYENAVASGCEWLTISQEEQQKFYDAAMTYNQNWIDGHTTSDFDAQAYYDLILSTAEKYAE